MRTPDIVPPQPDGGSVLPDPVLATVRAEGELAANEPPAGMLIPAATSPSRVASMVRGSAWLVAGSATTVVALAVVDLDGLLTAAAALVGLAAAYIGLSTLLRQVFGPYFDTGVWLAVVWLVLVIGSAALAPLLPLGEHTDTAASLLEPSYQSPDLASPHPLGTNNFGLDMLARIVYGARASLVIAVVAVLIGMVIGGSIGIVAGFFRGRADSLIGVLTNAVLAVPPLILLIALATVLDPSIRNIALVLALLGIPGQIRIARANTLAIATREFVTAARAMGATRWRIMFRELLPSVAIPVASLGMVVISVLIVAEASLSFLGLGIQPPDPSWGNMIAEGREGVLETHPHIVLVPGTILFITVFAFNLVGEKLRHRLDPRGSKL